MQAPIEIREKNDNLERRMQEREALPVVIAGGGIH